MSATKRPKRKADDEQNRVLTPPKPFTDDNRRKVRACLNSPGISTTPNNNNQDDTNSINSMSINSMVSNNTNTQLLNKGRRKKMYEQEMTRLNHSFAQWSHEAELQMTNYHQSQSGTNNTNNSKTAPAPKPTPLTPSDFSLLPAVQQYLTAARAIALNYHPPKFQMLTFGSGDCGQLALSEDVLESRRPKMVNSVTARVCSVACGGLHTVLAYERSGKVEVWGCNDHGSLGDCGMVGTGWLPMTMRGLIPSSEEVVGPGVLEDATKYWGDLSSLEREALTDPQKIRALSNEWDEPIRMVSAGDCQTLMLSVTGRLYFCGCYKDKEGKMWRDSAPPDDPRVLHPTEKLRGIVAPEGSQDWPIHLHQMPGKVEGISCGASFNAAIVLLKRNDDDGQASGMQRSCVTWGFGECGELARPVYSPLKTPEGEFHIDKARDQYLLPQPVIWADRALTNTHVVHNIACGAFHLLVVAKDGEGGPLNVYAAGLNNYGQLGLGDLDARKELTKISAFDGSNISEVAAGVHHSLCLDSSGRNLYGMGRGDSGQMGITSERPEVGFNKELPVSIKISDDRPVIQKISCGGNHCIALLDNGDAYSWGYGDLNQLGHGVEQDEYSPRKFDPVFGINRKRAKDGASPLIAKIEIIDGGGQHSAVTICSSIV